MTCCFLFSSSTPPRPHQCRPSTGAGAPPFRIFPLFQELLQFYLSKTPSSVQIGTSVNEDIHRLRKEYPKAASRHPPLLLSCSPLCVHRCLGIQPCLTLCNPTDCGLSGSSVHGILQARILVGCYVLLQRIFPTQRSNLSLLRLSPALQADSLRRIHRSPVTSANQRRENDSLSGNPSPYLLECLSFLPGHSFCLFLASVCIPASPWTWKPRASLVSLLLAGLSAPYFSMGSLGDRSPFLLPGHLHRNHGDFHTAPFWSEVLLYRMVWLHGTFWFVINSAGFCATARGENCSFGEIYCEFQTVLKLLECHSILDANILFFVLWNFIAVKGW